MTIENDLPPRGSFPSGPRGETLSAKRERYEQFILSTDGGRPDCEGQSIRFYRGRTKLVRLGLGLQGSKEVASTPSRALAITSRCWQCEHGDEDSNGQQRIAACKVVACGLWPLRPYQGDDASAPAKPPAGMRASAVRSYCTDCMGGNQLQVRHCTAVTCALWLVRTGADLGDADPASPDSPDSQGIATEGATTGVPNCNR